MKLKQLKKEILARMEYEEDLDFDVANLFTVTRLEKGLKETIDYYLNEYNK